MAAACKIEKGVPYPLKDKWPLADMEVGDSFVAPIAGSASLSLAPNQHRPKRFSLLKISDTECRMWRVA